MTTPTAIRALLDAVDLLTFAMQPDVSAELRASLFAEARRRIEDVARGLET